MNGNDDDGLCFAVDETDRPALSVVYFAPTIAFIFSFYVLMTIWFSYLTR